MEENVKVKAKFKGTSRRFEISSTATWRELLDQLRRFFEVEDFVVKYCDDENELVSVSSQDELNEAIRLCKRTSKLLYLHIEDPSTEQSSDPTLLELEERNTKKKEKAKKESSNSSCYSDLSSAMASELAALNSKLEKTAEEQAKKKVPPEPKKEKGQDGQQMKNDKKKESSGASCYADLSSAIAPELAALNERLSKVSLKDEESKKPANEPQPATRAAGTPPSGPEAPKSCYINLEDVMAQSRQRESSDAQPSEDNPQSTSANLGASRGWFNEFEEYQGQQGVSPAAQPKVKKTKKKKSKKQGCYSELSLAMASELARVTVRENVSVQKESSDIPSENAEIVNNDDGMHKEEDVTLKEPPAKFNSESKRQLDQSGNQNIKKPKKSRKRGGSKSCYSMMTEDIAPLFQAMNKRLEEKQQKVETVVQLMAPPEQDAPSEQEVLQCASSPESSSSEPFVFVHSESVEDGVVDPEMPPNPSYVDVVADGIGPQKSLEQPSEQSQLLNSEPNLISFDDERDLVSQEPGQEDEKMKVLMKEVLHESMDAIVNEAIQRLQTPNTKTPATPCNTPQGQTTPLGVVVHKGITCDSCGTEVHGIRYKCGNCKDFDLCETCEEMPGIHNMEHVFVKLRFQAPGIGRRHGEMVPIFKKSVYKKDCEKRQKEKELRRAAKEAEKERKRALKKQKHSLKAQEKERKRREKAKKIQGIEEPKKAEISQVYERLQASFVKDANFPDGSVVSPGERFTKAWCIRNDGDIAWNQWITLECIEGSIIGYPSAVPHLKPGSSHVVNVEFLAPEVPGKYFSKWQLSYGLHTFGPHLWCEVEVPQQKEGEGSILHDQHTLVDTAFKTDASPETNEKLVYETKLQGTNMEDDSSSEYLSSEDTPDPEPAMFSDSLEQKNGLSLASSQNDTSFSLVGQQRQDLEWDAGCAHDLEIVNVEPLEVEPRRERRLTDNWSIVDSEESDGEESDSSLDEFTVLIPTCFDPDAPLTADPVPVLVTSVKEKMSHSLSSPFLNSLEPEIDFDVSGPSSLPNIEFTPNEELTPSKDTHSHTDESPSPEKDDDEEEEPKQDVSTPSGRISPRDPSPQEAVTMEVPVSMQPSMSPRGSIPLVTQPTTVVETRRYRSTTTEDENDSNNIVTEVLSSAIDVVTMAGRAALATVDNLLTGGGGVQATATYKPEDECEVTVNRNSRSDCDAPPPPPLVWPMNRTTTDPMDRLIEMGFCDRKLNQRLLQKNKNDLRATIEELLGHTENDWSSQRH